MYINAHQLSLLIDCSPNSYSCMRRWLDRNGWPYAVGLSGFPKVSRAYHDMRLNSTTALPPMEQEPNFGALK